MHLSIFEPLPGKYGVRLDELEAGAFDTPKEALDYMTKYVLGCAHTTLRGLCMEKYGHPNLWPDDIQIVITLRRIEAVLDAQRETLDNS